jgi:hypothetical protein
LRLLQQYALGEIMRKTAILLGTFTLLLIISSMFAVFEYNNVLSLRSEISKSVSLYKQFNSTINKLSQEDQLVNQLNSTIDQRDTLIMQLDTALNLTQSMLNLNLPNGSQYLLTLPDSNNNGSITKIFLQSSAAWYHYGPIYPFDAPWFKDTDGGYFSSQRMFELTDNRVIPLSFWGWTFGDSGNYEYESRNGDPYLMIGVTVRNDYTSVDAGNGSDPNAPIGKSTPYYESVYGLNTNYVSFVNLSVKLLSKNGTAISAEDVSGIQSPTARGGTYFLLESGETKQVVFYLSPSSLDIAGFEIYVSDLSSVPQLPLP